MKKMWKENRVLFMLIIILVICFIAIVSVAFTFFYSSKVSKYGSRLDDIENYPVTSKDKNNYKETLLENENVTKVSVEVPQRKVRLTVHFNDEIDLEDAKAIIVNSLDMFSEDILSYYDVEFLLLSDNFTTLGNKNAVIEHISWVNNRVVEEETNEK